MKGHNGNSGLWFIISSCEMLLVHPIVGLAIVGIAYAWVVTYRELRKANVLEWPQKIALLSVVAATMQVPIPFVLAFIVLFNDRHSPTMGWIAGLEVLFFLVSLPCALTRKGLARWCLAFSSIVLLVFTGFVYALSQWEF